MVSLHAAAETFPTDVDIMCSTSECKNPQKKGNSISVLYIAATAVGKHIINIL